MTSEVEARKGHQLRNPSFLQILVLTKRQYMSKDLLDDRFGRFREIPLALGQKGHKVHGICLSYAKRNEGSIKDGPVFWKSINATRLKLPGLLRFVIEAQKLAKKSDIIWACSDSFYGVIGCAMGKMYKVPVVFDIYDNFGRFFIARLPVLKQLYHWAIRKSDAVTCLSKSFAGYVKNTFGNHIRVYPIEFAVRDDLFKPLDKTHCRQMFGLPLNSLIVGTAGALYKVRDVHLLFEAFKYLKDKYANLHLALAGPRDIEIPDNARIHDCGILPFEKVPYFINALDVAVVCYADDDYGKYCFPQKTREFMACDVPVIAAGVGSLRELLIDRPRWLYAPGAPMDLARVLKKRLVDRATNYSPPPTWSDLANRLENIMLKILNEKK